MKKIIVKCSKEKYDINNNIKNEDKDIIVRKATVDYISGKKVYLPDVEPFNEKVYLSNKYLFDMREIICLPNGKIQYFYNDIIDISHTSVVIKKVIENYLYTFEFELNEIEE